jgi:hypothetical protein
MTDFGIGQVEDLEGYDTRMVQGESQGAARSSAMGASGNSTEK